MTIGDRLCPKGWAWMVFDCDFMPDELDCSHCVEPLSPMMETMGELFRRVYIGDVHLLPSTEVSGWLLEAKREFPDFRRYGAVMGEEWNTDVHRWFKKWFGNDS